WLTPTSGSTRRTTRSGRPAGGWRTPTLSGATRC
ncbi:MAG: hypothetical protein AVDCRST_MAG03-1975, partial [uncultured Rubrobacteraceae bacterium]